MSAEFIYNKDGSIAYQNEKTYKQQGNNNVNEIFVFVKEIEGTYTAYFELPNGEVNNLEDLQEETRTINGEEINGYVFNLTEDQTQYYGRVVMSIRVDFGTDKILYTYPVNLIINKTQGDSYGNNL